MDIATLTNAPRELVLGGLRYQVRALTLSAWGELHAWIKDRVDDPITEALRQVDKVRRKGYSVSSEAEARLIDAARVDQRSWPPQVMSRQWFDLLGRTPGGSARFLAAMLRPDQPSMTEEQVEALERAISSEDCDELISAAIGLEPPPKASAPGSGPPARKPVTRRSETTGRSTSKA